jgi:hypothetical protein
VYRSYVCYTVTDITFHSLFSVVVQVIIKLENVVSKETSVLSYVIDTDSKNIHQDPPVTDMDAHSTVPLLVCFARCSRVPEAEDRVQTCSNLLMEILLANAS